MSFTVRKNGSFFIVERTSIITYLLRGFRYYPFFFEESAVDSHRNLKIKITGRKNKPYPNDSIFLNAL